MGILQPSDLDSSCKKTSQNNFSLN